MGIQLFSHNQTAYDVALAMLDSCGKAAIIHPTGTGKSLSLWLTRQRKYKTEAKLSEEQIKRLESLEMDWLTPSEREWETHYESAKDYYQKNGDLKIPCAYVDESGFPLGMWIWRIRAGKVKLKSSGANGNQLERLKEIGFDFSPVS